MDKRPPKYIPFLAFTVLVLLQWPASYVIQFYSLNGGVLLNEIIFVLGIPLLITACWHLPQAEYFPFKKPVTKEIFWLVIMTLALVNIIDYLTFLSEKIWPLPEAIRQLLEKIMAVSSFEEGVLRLLLICLLPAFCEEMFFRGYFQKSLSKFWGSKTAWIVTGLAFALIHGIPWYWHLYLILGLYLSWLMWIKNNLWFPMLAHLINNSWTFLNHLAGHKTPAKDIWLPQDSLVLAVCLVVFALAASRFAQKSS
ncbi:MAG: type II CAAX endopeptidase family protein [Deltaproteobacteria bacterium]|nr:type II CAAX endopeptidase family protein [Deltaproteobacteria bacterium]